MQTVDMREADNIQLNIKLLVSKCAIFHTRIIRRHSDIYYYVFLFGQM